MYNQPLTRVHVCLLPFLAEAGLCAPQRPLPYEAKAHHSVDTAMRASTTAS